MARKFEMTWFPPRNCWYGKRDGRRYYVPIKCEGKTNDPDGYSASLSSWKNKQKELDNAPAVPKPSSPKMDAGDRALLKRLMCVVPDGRTEDDLIMQVLRWKQRASDPLYGTSEAAKWMKMAEERKTAVATPSDLSMEAITKKFLDFKVAQSVSGMKSAGRALNLMTYMKPFKTFVGADRPVTDINELTLFDYHAKALKDVAAGVLTDGTARDRLQVAKQFLRWGGN